MFKTLFRYELKKQFPTQRKEKKDFVGSLVSMLATLTIIGVLWIITPYIMYKISLIPERTKKTLTGTDKQYGCHLHHNKYIRLLLVFAIKLFFYLHEQINIYNKKDD